MNAQDRGEVPAERIEDMATVATLAGLLRAPGGTSEVVLSGRCGGCGYMLGSEGHKISCD